MRVQGLRSQVLQRSKRPQDLELEAGSGQHASPDAAKPRQVSTKRIWATQQRKELCCCSILFLLACAVEYLLLTVDISTMMLSTKPVSVREIARNVSATQIVKEQHRLDPLTELSSALETAMETVSTEENSPEDARDSTETDAEMPTESAIDTEPVQDSFGSSSGSTPTIDLPVVEPKVGVKQVEEIWLETGGEGEAAEHEEEPEEEPILVNGNVKPSRVLIANGTTEESHHGESVPSSALEHDESPAASEVADGFDASNEGSNAGMSLESGEVIRVDFVFHRLYSTRKPLMNCNLTDEELLFALRKMQRIWLKAKINLTFDDAAVLEREIVSPDLEENFERYLLKYPKDDESGLPWTTRNKGNLGRVAKTLETTIPKLVRWEGRHLVHAYGVGAYVGYNGLSFNSKIYIRTQRYHKSDSVMDKAQFGRILAHEVGHRFGLHHPAERSNNLMVQQRSVPENFDPRDAITLTKSQIMYARAIASKMDVRMHPAAGSTVLGETSEQTVMFFQVYRAVMVQQPVSERLIGRRIVAVRLKVDLRRKYQRDIEFSIIAVKMDDVRCNKKLQVKVIGSGVIPTRKMEKGSLRHVTVELPAALNVSMKERGYIGIRFFRKVGLGVVPRAGNAPSRWPCSRDKNVAVVNFEFAADKT